MKHLLITAASLVTMALAPAPAAAQAMLQPFGSECFRFGRTPDSFGGCWVRTPSGNAIQLREGSFGRIEATPIPNQGAPSRYPLQPPGY
jgi:hypothetical protein